MTRMVFSVGLSWTQCMLFVVLVTLMRRVACLRHHLWLW
jgi:hypothetical protein